MASFDQERKGHRHTGHGLAAAICYETMNIRTGGRRCIVLSTLYDHRPDNDLPTWSLKGKHACDFAPWTAKIQEGKTSGTAKASPNSGPRAFSALRR